MNLVLMPSSHGFPNILSCWYGNDLFLWLDMPSDNHAFLWLSRHCPIHAKQLTQKSLHTQTSQAQSAQTTFLQGKHFASQGSLFPKRAVFGSCKSPEKIYCTITRSHCPVSGCLFPCQKPDPDAGSTDPMSPTCWALPSTLAPWKK